jgi:two-component system, response regulator
MTTPRPGILLVEDDPGDADMTLRVLASCNLDRDVIVLRDGMEAIDFLHRVVDRKEDRGLPDLILLDLKLPKMSGFEVLQWMRADRRTELIPVIVLTGARHESQVLALQKLGIAGFLEKPLTAASFLRCVNGLRSFQVPAAP